jgi:hypothetical protein
VAACGDCRFWKPSPHAQVPGVQYGECRAVAPQKHNGDRPSEGWALCKADDWCGLHKPKPPESNA